MESGSAEKPWKIVVAFAALYIIWGSTYLAIKVAVDTMPPLLMAAARFFLAGIILYAIMRARGVKAPSLQQWKHAAIVGPLLLAGGNGIVSIAEQRIDSSTAALIIATNPLLTALYGWWGGVQKKPTLPIWISLVVGLGGVGLLVYTPDTAISQSTLVGNLLVVLAMNFWVIGSIYSKRTPQTVDPFIQSAMQMLTGGMACLLIGLLFGEPSQVSLDVFSFDSWIAFLYLVFMGSLAGFTSYVYLLKHCTPSAVSSHAYINPAVAVILGWLVLGERLTPLGTLGAAFVIVSVFILLRQLRKR